jgi:hypothetical protein
MRGSKLVVPDVSTGVTLVGRVIGDIRQSGESKRSTPDTFCKVVRPAPPRILTQTPMMRFAVALSVIVPMFFSTVSAEATGVAVASAYVLMYSPTFLLDPYEGDT